jgi:alpha-beta hydrolase superfamily lysophospholipase
MATNTVPRIDRTFIDDHGVTIHFHVWSPVEPKAVVQLAHGLGEYAARYEALAQNLVAAGYAVYADDHRGHGQTGLEQHGGDHSKLGKLGPGGNRAAVDGLLHLNRIIKAEHPGLPVAFLGQSWGTLLGQKLMNEHIDEFAAVVFAGTANRVPGQMNGGDLNKRHQALGTTGYEWLSRDPKVSAAFLADPLCFYADALKLFGVVDGLRLFGRPAKPMPADVPLLIMIGSDDSLGGEVSVHNLADSYISRGELTDVEVLIYDGARHEVFNETNRDEVVRDLVAWLDGRVTVSS